MFELPEVVTLTRQMRETLPGKRIAEGLLGNRPHTFVWYNVDHAVFSARTRGLTVDRVRSAGRWIFVPLEPGAVLAFGECGGRLLYHPPGEPTPAAYHLLLRFEDGSALSETTDMWGAMELHDAGAELERQGVRGMRPGPLDEAFDWPAFEALVREVAAGRKRSAKALLVRDGLIPGLGNAIAQDILFTARLHPRHPVQALDPGQRRALFEAIGSVVSAAVAQGGRSEEVDLFGHPGGYERIMGRAAVGKPCPRCGETVQKLQFEGGSCYLCPGCQV